MKRETEAKKRVVKRPTTKKNEGMTLLDAVEKIAAKVEDSSLSQECLDSIAEEIAFLTKSLNITEHEALILSVAASFYGEWCILQEYATYMDCSRLQLLHYVDALHSLRKRRFVRVRTRNDKEMYQISNDALKAIRENRDIEAPKTTGLTLEEFFDCVSKLVSQRRDDELSYDNFCEDLAELIKLNQSIDFVGALKKFGLDSDDTAFFLWACNMLVNDNDGVIVSFDLEALYDGSHLHLRERKNDLRNPKSPLFKNDLIRPINNEGIGSAEEFELTPYSRNELLKGLGVEVQKKSDKRLLSHTTITPKQLYYNPCEERALKQLRSLLEPEQFEGICSRLEAKGLRRGFACLFYGAPGTGKTETVLQLARQTGRDLMQVNISEIKSMWVGESEKNIKAAFDHYRQLVARSERAPILLFNEADAILGKRNEGAERAVDKMENAIQNIILQEMEQLEGIMIATTNLTKNLDKAFERRFIYKIEFERPTIEARTAIWQSMIPNLDEGVALSLAAQYDFSGGQIEDIARKRTVSLILSGAEPSAEQLDDFCRAEILSHKPTEHRKIGF